jgi:ribosomal protein S27E
MQLFNVALPRNRRYDAGIMRQMDSPPVLLAQYMNVSEAMVAKSILESAGIASFLANSNIVHMYCLIPDVFGGVKLLVGADDLEAADGILKQSTLAKFDGEGIGEYVRPHCPGCESTEVSFEGPEKPERDVSRFVVPSVSLIQQNNAAQYWRCHVCGRRWKESDPDLPPASLPELKQ